jgi:hypothetical protein
MKRVVVRVYAGDAKTKGNPLAEVHRISGSSLSTPGTSNVDWTTGTSDRHAGGNNGHARRLMAAAHAATNH